MEQPSWFDKQHEQELVRDLGLFAVKTTITFCGGGFLAILTFWAKMSASDGIEIDVQRLRFSLLVLLAGILFSMLAVLVSFLNSQIRLGNEGASRLDRANAPWFLVVQMSPLIIAFALFLWGACLAIYSFG